MRLPLKDTIDARVKLTCVERELKFRRRAFPRWVSVGRMKQDEADFEIEVMESIRADYMAQVKDAR